MNTPTLIASLYFPLSSQLNHNRYPQEHGAFSVTLGYLAPRSLAPSFFVPRFSNVLLAEFNPRTRFTSVHRTRRHCLFSRPRQLVVLWYGMELSV
jgi:hypothetical protein